MSGRTITVTLANGRRIVCDDPPPLIVTIALQARVKVEAGLSPDQEDAAVLWRWVREQERLHPSAWWELL